MSDQLMTVRMIHEDHMEKLRFLSSLDRLLAAFPDGMVPPAGDSLYASAHADIKTHLTRRPDPHFAFEEDVLFPMLADDGADDLQRLLCDEHREIEAIADALLEAAIKLTAAEVDAATWTQFRTLARELGAVLTSHIDKEEAALPSLLAEILDAEEDQRISLLYAETK
jgi:hemerythrin-like domain-containing protein